MQANSPKLNISSAGISALVDKPIHESSGKVLIAHGYNSNGHIARQLNTQIIEEADLILVMENFQQQRLMKHYPAASGKVMLLGKWLNNLEINDPYRKSAEAFGLVFKQIESACNLWSDKLGSS